jgi:hypothetical protein
MRRRATRSYLSLKIYHHLEDTMSENEQLPAANPIGAVVLPRAPRAGSRNHALAGAKARPSAATTFTDGGTVVSVISFPAS